MALGDLSNTVQAGGQLPPNSALQARTVVAIGPCTLGTPNTLYQLGSSLAVTSGLDTGALADYCAKLLQHGAGSVFGLVVSPSAVGAISASVTQVGNGLGTMTPTVGPHKSITIKCTTGGAIATMKVQFSLDGGSTYGAITTSADSGAGSWVYLVPGTYCTLTFAAATYVATKTNTIGVDGTVTPGSAWVGTVTQASSPIDNYNVLVTVANGGVLGVATVSISLDGGLSQLPNTLVPAAGVVVPPATGLILTFANNGGSFTAGDTYSFKAIGPSFSTSDVTTAINAVRSAPTTPTVALAHVITPASSAANAISMASTLDGALVTLATSQYGKNWSGVVECPSKSAGDTVVSGGNAIVDTADTDTVIRAARVGSSFLRTSVFVGTQPQRNALNSYALARPAGWGLAARFVEADPSSDPACVGTGQLDFVLVNGALGRDEFSSAVTLYDAQFNTLRTYPNRAGAYLSIESGGVGWRNMNTLQGWQDANFIRLLNVFLAAITAAGQKYLASRQPTNTDGTITKAAASIISSDLDNVAKQSVGVTKGGAFVSPQASAASAGVLLTSQLGNVPKRLDVQYGLQSLGLISAINDAIAIS